MSRPGRYKEWKASDQARGLLAVNAAVRRGLLPPIKSVWCLSCMKPAQVYHHHNGYDDEHLLDVVPLCYKCHTVAHTINGTYVGDTPGREWEVVARLHSGWSVTRLAQEYRCTKQVVRSIIATYSQITLPGVDFFSGKLKKGLTNAPGGGIMYLHKSPAPRRQQARKKPVSVNTALDITWMDT